MKYGLTGPVMPQVAACASGPSLSFATPEEATVLEFQRILRDGNVPAFIRKPRGREIFSDLVRQADEKARQLAEAAARAKAEAEAAEEKRIADEKSRADLLESFIFSGR